MKLFVFLVFIGVCAAAEHHANFCKGNKAAKGDAAAVRSVIKLYLPQVIGHCATAQAALDDDTFFGGECVRAFDEGFCYAADLYETYEVDEKLNECTYGESTEEFTVTVTYEDMATVLSSDGDAIKLGHLACRHALPCFEKVVSQLAECAKNDDSFYTTAVEKARELLEPLISKHKDEFESSLICHFGSDSDAMALLRMVQDRITSFDDIVDLINKYVNDNEQDSIVSEARAGLNNFIGASNAFCDAKCFKKSAAYFNLLFAATHDADTCPTVEVYCGGCQNAADSHISANAGSLPCCTQTALGSIVETIQSVIDEYSVLIGKIEAAVTATVQEAGVTTEDYETLKAFAAEQAHCLEDTYEALADSECSKKGRRA